MTLPSWDLLSCDQEDVTVALKYWIDTAYATLREREPNHRGFDLV